MDQQNNIGFLALLKKYWKYFIGLLSIFLGYFLYKRNENEWKKNYENSLKNEKKIREVNVESLEKQAKEKETIEKEKNESLARSSSEIKKMKEELKNKKSKEKNKESIAKSIAELTGAEYVDKD